MTTGAVHERVARRDTRILRAVSNAVVSRAFLVDMGLVLVFAGSHLLVLVFEPHPPGGMWWWPLLISVPAMMSLLVRRYLPWTGLTVLLAVTIGFTWFAVPVGPLNLAILVAVYSVCLRTELLGAVASASLAMVWPVTRVPSLPVGDGIVMIAGSVVNLVMVVGWGRAMRVKHRRADQLTQTVTLLDQARDQLAAEAATVERARIAREFHDIVSHSLSVIALRAGVARSLVDRDPDHARVTLGELERTSRTALEEMRHLLGALREDPGAVSDTAAAPGADRSSRQPAPGLRQVEELIESVRETGVVWRLDRRGAVRDLGAGVEMTAYRIVQEAVTNVLKHAGSGYARVLLEYGHASVRIEVTNHATGAELPSGADRESRSSSREHASFSSGHGLIGLRERVGLLGGTLTAHPIAKGFHLSAVLPFSEASDLV